MLKITRIRIVTDSASDITWKYADENNIKIVPLTVLYHDKVFKESRDYDFEDHYKNYETEKNFTPKTSQPTPKEFYLAFEEVIKEGAEDIFVICISGKLSGTLNSAKVAMDQIKEQYDKVKIHLIDSKNASYGEGFLIEEAVKQIKEEKSAEEIKRVLEKLVSMINSYLLIPTLKYLYLGGRVSIAKYLLARLLNKMAIIRTAPDGSLQPLGAVGSLQEGVEKIVNIATKEGSNFPRKVSVVYAKNKDLKDLAIKHIEEYMPTNNIRVVQTRAAITAHVGPNAIAIVVDYGLKE